jgi:hypothetical protein
MGSLLMNFLSWLAPAITAWAVQFFTRKMVVVGSMITTFVFMTAAFVACIKIIITSILLALSLPAWIAAGIAMFLPANFAMCLAAIGSAKSCRWAYDKAREKLQIVASSN